MELMVYFHDYIIVILLIILGFVLYIFIIISSTKFLDKYTIDQHLLELFWTLLPIAILIFIAFPSLYLLYLTEDTTNPSILWKVVGHQWYWEYQHEGPLSSNLHFFMSEQDSFNPDTYTIKIERRFSSNGISSYYNPSGGAGGGGHNPPNCPIPGCRINHFGLTHATHIIYKCQGWNDAQIKAQILRSTFDLMWEAAHNRGVPTWKGSPLYEKARILSLESKFWLAVYKWLDSVKREKAKKKKKK